MNSHHTSTARTIDVALKHNSGCYRLLCGAIEGWVVSTEQLICHGSRERKHPMVAEVARLILSRPKNRRRMQNLTSKGLRVDEKPTIVVYKRKIKPNLVRQRFAKPRVGGLSPLFRFESEIFHHSKDNFMR